MVKGRGSNQVESAEKAQKINSGKEVRPEEQGWDPGWHAGPGQGKKQQVGARTVVQNSFGTLVHEHIKMA